jgi:predicted TIM-barrel fold metal-dependent hydrolase
MDTTTTKPVPETLPKTGLNLIDCDVHQAFRTPRDLLPYLREPWKTRYAEGGLGYPGSGYFSEVGIDRRDAKPDDGGPAGSDPSFTAKDLFDRYGVDFGIVNGAGILGISVCTDPDYSAALATAYNDWMIETWLQADKRYRGALVVSTTDPALAAKEIDRVGGHPAIVQVLMASAARVPLGQRQYHPIYEAAERNGLPVAIHPGTEGAGIANPPTAAGYPTRYIEWHTLLPGNFQAHLVSLVTEGVFVKYPQLKFVLVEGGVAWLAPLMWRLDKNYKALRAEVPWLTERPSDYIREHVYLTTQPIEEPDDPKHLPQIIEMMGAEHMLLYSSDYPHWDFDDPIVALSHMSPYLRQRIRVENARELYKL